jgi:hypothetical protein
VVILPHQPKKVDIWIWLQTLNFRLPMTLFRIRFGIWKFGEKKTSFQFGFSLNYVEVNCNSFTVKHVSFIQKAAAAAKNTLFILYFVT